MLRSTSRRSCRTRSGAQQLYTPLDDLRTSDAGGLCRMPELLRARLVNHAAGSQVLPIPRCFLRLPLPLELLRAFALPDPP